MSIETIITIPGDYKLEGTLTIPEVSRTTKTKLPAILLVTPIGGDRDYNLWPLISTNIYKILAKKLTEMGLITLRYDNKGCGKSEGDYKSSGISDSLNDAVRAIQFLKTIEQVDPHKIIYLGHSESAIIGPAIYERAPVAGMILLCGAALPGPELVRRPVAKTCQELAELKGIKGFIVRLFRLENIVNNLFNQYLNKILATKNSVITLLGIKLFMAKYGREFYNFNPEQHLKKLNCPTLVICGEKDIQSEPQFAKEITKLIPGPSQAIIIPNMNHMLRTWHGKHTALSAGIDYGKSVKDDLSSGLIKNINGWLYRNKFTTTTMESEQPKLETSIVPAL